MNTHTVESNLLLQGAYLLLALLALGAGVYYLVKSPPPPPAPLPTHYVICVDDSGSISADQIDLWKAPVGQIIERLASGDLITIIPVHDNTQTEQIFVRTLPALPDGAGYTETTAIREQWKQIREAAVKKLEELLAPKARSHSTDILSAFNRVHLAAGKTTVIIFLSDMLHSTAELNLERMRISNPEINAHVSSAFNKSGLHQGMLHGAKVHCFLNAIGINQAQPINDRISLKHFWSEVCRLLDAELVSFDTILSSDLEATN